MCCKTAAPPPCSPQLAVLLSHKGKRQAASDTWDSCPPSHFLFSDKASGYYLIAPNLEWNTETV